MRVWLGCGLPRSIIEKIFAEASIVMNSFNCGEFLRDAVDSALTRAIPRSRSFSSMTTRRTTVVTSFGGRSPDKTFLDS